LHPEATATWTKDVERQKAPRVSHLGLRFALKIEKQP
jgi:hypothetical protein